MKAMIGKAIEDGKWPTEEAWRVNKTAGLMAKWAGKEIEVTRCSMSHPEIPRGFITLECAPLGRSEAYPPSVRWKHGLKARTPT